MARRSPALATALEDWRTVRSAGRGLSPNTMRAYRADIAAVAAELTRPVDDGDDRPATERVTVDQLTPGAAGPRDATAPGRSPATRARIHGTLAGLCAHLVHQGQLRVDPLVGAGVERPILPQPETARDRRLRRRVSPGGPSSWYRSAAQLALLVNPRAGEPDWPRGRPPGRPPPDPRARACRGYSPSGSSESARRVRRASR